MEGLYNNNGKLCFYVVSDDGTVAVSFLPSAVDASGSVKVGNPAVIRHVASVEYVDGEYNRESNDFLCGSSSVSTEVSVDELVLGTMCRACRVMDNRKVFDLLRSYL